MEVRLGCWRKHPSTLWGAGESLGRCLSLSKRGRTIPDYVEPSIRKEGILRMFYEVRGEKRGEALTILPGKRGERRQIGVGAFHGPCDAEPGGGLLSLSRHKGSLPQ